MRVKKSESRVLDRALAEWARTGHLSPEIYERLSASYQVESFDWRLISRYAFWFALTCIVIAAGAVLMDDALVALLRSIFNAPAWLRATVCGACAAGVFWLGASYRRLEPARHYTTEAIFFLGVACMAGAITQVGIAMGASDGQIAPLVLAAALAYAALGVWLRSTLVWIFALLSFAGWLGAESGYRSGWGGYFFGMNYPLRFAIFGVALVAWSIGLDRWRRTRALARPTLAVGLLHAFVSLWLLSIFGNHGSWDEWAGVSQTTLAGWALASGIAAIGAVWFGVRRDDRMLIGFGLTFFWINLYTRYFEYFWGGLHAAVFFAVLGASFWWLGAHAESLALYDRDAPWWRLLVPRRPHASQRT